jgi:hypothetical protein
LDLSFSEWLQLLSAPIIANHRTFSQSFFDELANKISTSSSSDRQLSEFKKDIVLYNALSYIAFSGPQEGQSIIIKGIPYSIEKIPLTSRWLSSTYYAYGLKATTDKMAQSFMIFHGSTTPSDHRFLAGLLADTYETHRSH